MSFTPALGLSTATVSKVIHGKTEKISDQTVKRVQQELERSGYLLLFLQCPIFMHLSL